jgi:hypothetical protein
VKEERKTLNRPRAIAAIAGVLLLAGMWPTSYLASPRWEVWVTSADGQPIRGINVRLVYENYSTEGASHEVTLKTNDSGYAAFPSNWQRACFVQRAVYTVSAAAGGVHASFGRHAYVFVFGDGYEGDAVTGGYVTDWTGNPNWMQSRILAKPTDTR